MRRTGRNKAILFASTAILDTYNHHRKDVQNILKIVDELKECVFGESSEILDKLASEWHNINAKFLSHFGQKNFESAFLNVLTEEIHANLPDFKVITHVKLRAIPASSGGEKVEDVLGMHLKDIREVLCGSYAYSPCHLPKCFGGEYPSGTEIDALIIRGEDLCFLEYETTRKGLCFDFMKMHRLHQLLNKRLESLFVTKLTTKSLPERPTTFDSFNDHVDNIKSILDAIIPNWSILEVVDLSGSRRRRRFHWKP